MASAEAPARAPPRAEAQSSQDSSTWQILQSLRTRLQFLSVNYNREKCAHMWKVCMSWHIPLIIKVNINDHHESKQFEHLDSSSTLRALKPPKEATAFNMPLDEHPEPRGWNVNRPDFPATLTLIPHRVPAFFTSTESSGFPANQLPSSQRAAGVLPRGERKLPGSSCNHVLPPSCLADGVGTADGHVSSPLPVLTFFCGEPFLLPAL